MVWKRTVSNAVNNLATSERLSRMEQDTDYTGSKMCIVKRFSADG